MLVFKNDIINNFLPQSTLMFEVQTYKQLIHLLSTLYKNIGSFENVKVTLPHSRFENGLYYTADVCIYIDSRFLDSYWRGIMKKYCPCRYNPYVRNNSHAHNFMRLSPIPYPSFAVAFALRYYMNYFDRNFKLFYSPYFYYNYRTMPCCNPIPMTISHNDNNYRVYVPCGKCYACQSAKRAAFALRCRSQMELYKNFGSNYFVTLTYDDNHLFSFKSRSVVNRYLVDQSQLLDKDRHYDIFLLEKNKFSLFMRRFRRRLKQFCNIKDFKFIASGEYGTLHNRPHYHFLFFSPTYIRYDYLSDIIGKLWTNGTNEVQLMHDANINYVGKHSVKSDLGCQYQQQFAPAFMLYSLKGGSVGYHLKHSAFYHNIYKSGQKFVKMGKYKYYFPRFLSKAFHPENMNAIELKTLEQSTGEMFDRFMYLYDNDSSQPIFIKSRLMREDFQKRMKYERFRLLKKVKKTRMSLT